MKPGALDFSDRRALDAWLRDVESLADDIAAVLRDQLRAPARRELGRRMAARLGDEASGALARQLAFARRGLGRRRGAT